MHISIIGQGGEILCFTSVRHLRYMHRHSLLHIRHDLQYVYGTVVLAVHVYGRCRLVLCLQSVPPGGNALGLHHPPHSRHNLDEIHSQFLLLIYVLLHLHLEYRSNKAYCIQHIP